MSDKKIVLTMYGKDESIENISIALFELDSSYSSQNSAFNYCKNINDLELKGNNWIYATVINENEKIILSKPPVFDFINNLYDISIQRLLRVINKTDLAKALIGIDDRTKEKIFKNMTKRAAIMLREDIATLNDTDIDEIKSSRNKVIQAIQRLCYTGEITEVFFFGANKEET